MDVDFVSPGYIGRSTFVNSEMMVNFFPELDEDGVTKSLVGTPGLSLFATVGGTSIRGTHNFNNLMYVISAGGLYSIDSSGTVSALLGTLATTTGRIEMAENGLTPAGGNQLFITDGSKFSYVYNVSTGIFSTLNSTNGTGCQLTINVVAGALVGTQMVTAVGSLYAVGDILTVAGGSGGKVQVSGVTGTAVNAVTVIAGGSGYTTGTLQVTAPVTPGFPVQGASDVTFIDGYFVIVTAGGSSSFQVSGIYDGLTWDALNKAAISFVPQQLTEVFNFNRDLWMFGPNGYEVWYDAGTGYPPFQRYNNGVGTHGIISGSSVAQSTEAMLWLAKSPAGGYHLKACTGIGNIKTVSTRSIEYQWSIYSLYSMQNSSAYVYEDESHMFYVLTFPADPAGGTPVNGATWVYDLTTNRWHQRSSYYVTASRNVGATVNRHLGNSYCFFNGKHYVGDLLSGKIFQMSSSFYTDNGDPIVRIRAGKALNADLKQTVFNSFQLDMEVGVGDGTSGQGGNPQVMLDWSDDSGVTWGQKIPASIGQMGQYRTRAIWRKLGVSRNRVFRATISDPVKTVIVKAMAEVTLGAN